MRPRYRLAGPKGRRYLFTPLGSGIVRVERYENLTRTEIRTVPRVRAVNTWRWLIRKLGYRW